MEEDEEVQAATCTAGASESDGSIILVHKPSHLRNLSILPSSLSSISPTSPFSLSRNQILDEVANAPVPVDGHASVARAMAAATAPGVAALVGRSAAAADPHLREGRVRVGVGGLGADSFCGMILERVCEVLWFSFDQFLDLVVFVIEGKAKIRGFVMVYPRSLDGLVEWGGLLCLARDVK